MMIKWKRFLRRNRQLRQYLIILAAALVMSLLATIIAQFLQTPHSVYYPHDEERSVIK